MIYVAVDEGGNGEADFTKFTRVPLSVAVLGERHQRLRTQNKERMSASREMLSAAQRDLGVDVTFQLVPNSTERPEHRLKDTLRQGEDTAGAQEEKTL